MYALRLPIVRNAVLSAEYYQPDLKATEGIGAVVEPLLKADLGSFLREHAKLYTSEQEAQDDVPNWIALLKENMPHYRARVGDATFEALMKEHITVVPVPCE